MAALIAAAGLSGAGKTTAIDYLEQLGAGRKVYVGDLVLDEVRRRRLKVDPHNEKAVRLELREMLGPAAFAALASPRVSELLSGGQNVLLDAIFCPEERRHFSEVCGDPIVVLAIVASFDLRAARLKIRASRPLTRVELLDRDQTEVVELHTDRVVAEATHQIINEGRLEDFKEALDNFWNQLSVGASGPLLREH